MSGMMTPRSDVDLCASCTHAFIREGYDGSRTTICQATPMPVVVLGNTSKCSEYRHKNQPDAFELGKLWPRK